MKAKIVIPKGWRQLSPRERLRIGDRQLYFAKDHRGLVWIAPLHAGWEGTEAGNSITIRKKANRR